VAFGCHLWFAPAGSTLTTSDGSAKATGVLGDLTMRSSNGKVTATDTRSEHVDASSSDGSVRLDLASSPTEVHATSGNGNVTVPCLISLASRIRSAAIPATAVKPCLCGPIHRHQGTSRPVAAMAMFR